MQTDRRPYPLVQAPHADSDRATHSNQFDSYPGVRESWQTITQLARRWFLKGVRQAMVLPISKSKLGLQKEIVPLHLTGLNYFGNPPAHGRLMVVLTRMDGVNYLFFIR